MYNLLAYVILYCFGALKVTAMALETLDIPHLPDSLPVHVALYRNVENSAFLRQQLLAGNAEFEYALIDASMVCLIFAQLLCTMG